MLRLRHAIKLLTTALLLFFSAVLPLHAQPTADQTLFLTLHVTGQAVTVRSVFVKLLAFYSTASHPADPYRYTLLSSSQKVLHTQAFHDPLVRIVDDFTDPQRPQGSKETLTESDMTLKVPDLKDATQIRFERLDTAGKWKLLNTVPLTRP